MNGRAFGVFCLSAAGAFACSAAGTGYASGPAAGATHDGRSADANAFPEPDDPSPAGEPYVWQAATRSPQRATPAPDDLSAACPAHDAALDRAARFIATRELSARVSTDAEEVTYVMRAEGAPYVRPRLWVLAGQRAGDEAGRRFGSWLATLARVNEVRCGTGLAQSAGHGVAVGVAVDVLADLEPLPTESRVGAWLELDARLLVPASAAKVLVLGPHGAPHAVPTTLEDGLVRAQFRTDHAGLWLAQVLATVEGGPRPVAEALVLAGSAPETLVASLPAPGEDAAAGSEPVEALTRMVNAARATERLGALVRDPRLDRVAQAHAEAMRDEHRLYHEDLSGSPADRLAGAGVAAESVGENVAHAADAAHAHRTLWQSPSHRSNLLDASVDTLGVGIARDADQTLWICELFASMKQR
jgi:uncharacterized protein YkwD